MVGNRIHGAHDGAYDDTCVVTSTGMGTVFLGKPRNTLFYSMEMYEIAPPEKA